MPILKTRKTARQYVETVLGPNAEMPFLNDLLRYYVDPENHDHFKEMLSTALRTAYDAGHWEGMEFTRSVYEHVAEKEILRNVERFEKERAENQKWIEDFEKRRREE